MSLTVFPPDGERTRIVLIEQHDVVRRSLHLLLNGWGYEVRSFAALRALTDSTLTQADFLLVGSDILTDGSGVESIL